MLSLSPFYFLVKNEHNLHRGGPPRAGELLTAFSKHWRALFLMGLGVSKKKSGLVETERNLE